MPKSTSHEEAHARAARAARGELEDALAARGWPIVRRLSLWIDCLVILEEAEA